MRVGLVRPCTRNYTIDKPLLIRIGERESFVLLLIIYFNCFLCFQCFDNLFKRDSTHCNIKLCPVVFSEEVFDNKYE